MPFYGTLDSLVEYRPPPAPNYFQAPQPVAEDDASLEALLADKAQCLADILADIDRDISSRMSLSRYVLHLISKHYSYLKTKLFELYTWQVGANRSIENRRSRLEQQLDALNQEMRLELVKAWQDISALRKEERSWLKQYRDMEQRIKLVLQGQQGTPHAVPRRLRIIPLPSRPASAR